MDSGEDEAAAFNKSSTTNRTPPNESPNLNIISRPETDTEPRRLRLRGTSQYLECVSCKITNLEKKIACPDCSSLHHLECVDSKHRLRLQNRTWKCDKCTIIIRNDSNPGESLKNPKTNTITESRSTGTKPKEIIVNNNEETTPDETQISNLSEKLPEMGRQSTQKPTSINSASSGKSSTSSRLSTSERLKMIDAEEETRRQTIIAEAALREKRLENQRKQLEMEAEMGRVEDQIKELAAKERFLKERRVAFDTPSHSGSSIHSVSSSEKLRSIDSWLTNLDHSKHAGHGDKLKDNPAANNGTSLNTVKQPKPTPQPVPSKSGDNRSQRSHRSRRSDNNTETAKQGRSTSKARQNPERSRAPWLQHNITTDEFLNSTLSGNTQISQELNLTHNQIQARHVIPKEIPVFSGDPLQWPQFISTFATSSQQCGFTPEENLARLNKCLKGAAYEAVRTDLLLPSSLGNALATLKLLFGRPQLIFETAVERIRQAPAVKLERLETIITLSLRVKTFCDVVRASGMADYLRNPSLVHELVEKLPPTLKMEWGRFRRKLEATDPIIGVDTFECWIRENAETASCLSNQPVAPITTAHNTKRDHKRPGEGFHAAHEAISDEEDETDREKAGKTRRATCPFCRDGDHEPKNCDRFLALSVDQRWTKVLDNGRCMGCFGRHLVRFCRRRAKCGINNCERPHNPLLHGTSTPEIKRANRSNTTLATSAETNNTETDRVATTEIQRTVNTHSKSVKQRSYYQVVPVTLYGKKGKKVKTHAFLDGGSTVTLLEQSVAEELELDGVKESLKLRWTNDVTRSEPDSQRIELRISGSEPDIYTLTEVRTARELSLPRQAMMREEIQQHPHLSTVDIETYEEIQPTILIGLDNHQLLMHLDIVEGGWDSPTAARTRLGWTLLGGALRTLSMHGDVNIHHEDDQNLHETVKNFFGLESLGIKVLTSVVESREDKRAKEVLHNSITRTPEGRYQAGLLWKEDEPQLPPSRKMAIHRHVCFERRLSRDPVLARAVEKQIAEYIEKGYLRKLTPMEVNQQTAKTWYLPIFAIKNPNKPAKIRLVWDAAATVNGISLNSQLLTGPDLLSSLVGVLLRFREQAVAVGADIRQMFHQVLIRPEDQEAQRCLWKPKDSQEIETYKMTVMTFGAACSPSTAQHVKNLNAEQYKNTHPRAVEAIHRRHYVDDYIDSFSTATECIRVANEVTEIHRSGGFELRGFVSNDPAVMAALNGDSEQGENSLCDQDPNTTILGMRWRTDKDQLCFRINRQRIGEDLLTASKTPTKRELLRILMMVFDPLGLLGFFILQGKLVLKEVWATKIDWDEKLGAAQAIRWAHWVRSLPLIESVQIPRSYFGYENIHHREIHTFVDASEFAAAAVVYIVGTSTAGRHVNFVASKTKIAPTKAMSIPRMELQAAVIGTRLTATIQEEQSCIIERRFYWSDSRNVLCWLKNPRTFKPFVALRVGEILENTTSDEWQWVPTEENVADEATKWKLTSRHCIPDRWFTGPQFLIDQKYPREHAHPIEPTDDELEVRCHLTRAEDNTESITPNMSRFRKLRTLLRVQVRVLRVFHRYHRKFGDSITPSELDEARLYLIRSTQIEAFGDAWYTVKEGNRVPKSHALYTLSPFIDPQSILRMRSRLKEAEFLTYEQRCPIILPRRHPFTQLLVASVHEKYYHQNIGTVLNEIKQEYYIPKLRSQLKSVRKKCQRCVLRDARPEVPEMAALPRSRMAARIRPFTYVGVDYFGPMVVKIGRRIEKRWGVIFTCLTIRAVHLEIATSLTADSFLLMLRSFIARRGIPKEIFCDNGTNFHGAESELRKTLQNNIANKVREQYVEIMWKFNPPAAPHMGGAWERLIRSVKNGLSYALPHKNPTEELLRCCLVEIESMVNSRPLTYVETEPHSMQALTPNHFLLGTSSGVKPYGDFTDDHAVLRKEWQRQQQITSVFWNRWVGEYLPTISQRTRWYDPVKPIQIGDVVAIVLENTPYSWRLGRIVDVKTSKDGSIRQADVMTDQGVLRRPASKLAVLVREDKELSDIQESSTGGSVADGGLPMNH